MDGRILHVNRAARQLLRLEGGDLSQLRLRDLILPSEREEALRQARQMAKQGGRWSGLLRLQLADGAMLSVRHDTGVVTDRQGQARYLYHLFQDCAKDLRHHEELLEAKLSAERANEAKTSFLSRMSHELRTPLNAILGFAQLMDLDPPADARHAGYVREILTAGRHLLTLINDVLDLSAVEAGRVTVDCRPLAMGELLRECVSLMRPLADARRIALTLPPEHAVRVRADRTRLKQVLLNLLSNAIKYNREAGAVRISVVSATAKVRITVGDTGPGIPRIPRPLVPALLASAPGGTDSRRTRHGLGRVPAPDGGHGRADRPVRDAVRPGLRVLDRVAARARCRLNPPDGVDIWQTPPDAKKPRLAGLHAVSAVFCRRRRNAFGGEGGIRTLGTLFTYA